MVRMIGLVFATMLMSLTFLASNVSATSPDWINTRLWVEYFDIPPNQTEYCSDKDTHFWSRQYSINRSLCVIGNDSWSVGKIGFADLGRDLTYQSSIVGLDLAHDGTMYTVEPDVFSPYNPYSKWYPIGTSNDALHLSYSDNGEGLQLYRYDNMPSKFHQNNVGNKLDGFTFDQSGYDFHLTRPDGDAIVVSMFAISTNREWAVMNARGIGVMVMDLKTNNIRRVLPLTDDDWSDIDNDNTGLAIADDGKYVARFTTTSQMILAIDSQCGDSITDTTIESQSLAKPCRTRDVGRSLGIYQDYSRYANLSFDKYMRWLDFDVGRPPMVTRGTAFSDGYHRIRITTEDSLERLAYLALGDSYSSGEGDVANGPIYYAPGTEARLHCHLSGRSYPYLLRDHYQIPELSMASVACSGAVVKDDYYRQFEGYKGQGDRLKDKGDDERESMQQASLYSFAPGNVPQLEFVKKYRPDIVTLTGGGNDVGFARIIQYCASSSYRNLGPTIIKVDDTCQYAMHGSKLQKELNASINTQYKYNREMIEKINEYSPGTKVIIIGYPKFIDKDRSSCNLAGGFLDDYERKMIDDAVVYMNKMLLRVANDTGVTFVDLTDSLKGGRICEGSKYVTDLWNLGVRKIKDGDTQEAFHPNAEGHKKMAQAIIGSNAFETSDMSARSTMRITSPDSDYEPQEDGPTTLQAKLFDSDVVVKSHGAATISSQPGLFGVGSMITVIANSETVNLGTFSATEDGSLSATIDTNLLPLGYHVVTVDGKAPDGSDVTLYQFVLVKETDDDDSYARSWGFDSELINPDAPTTDGAHDSILNNYQSTKMDGRVEDKAANGDKEKRIEAKQTQDDARSSSVKRNRGWLFTLGVTGLAVVLLVISGGVIYGISKQRRKTMGR